MRIALTLLLLTLAPQLVAAGEITRIWLTHAPDGEDSYVQLTVKRDGPMVVEIKSLKNTLLDWQDFER